MIDVRKLSWSTTNQTVCALRFLFHITLNRPEVSIAIPYRRAGSKQPEILSAEEVAAILAACGNLAHRTLLMTTYAAGLRLGEVCALRLADIDSDRMMIRVAGGKGAKDRYTLLSPQLLAALHLYWISHRPYYWLFPRKSDENLPTDAKTVQKIYYRAKQAAAADRWKQLLIALRRHDWVVYAKQPLGGPAQVLEYLSRYTHRVAISNERIVGMADGKIAFRVRDYANAGKKRIERLPAESFIGRFLLHALPTGFKRIRHYGLLAPCHKQEKLAACRQALAMPVPDKAVTESVQAFMQRAAAIDIGKCPCCEAGRLHLVGVIVPRRARCQSTGPPA